MKAFIFGWMATGIILNISNIANGDFTGLVWNWGVLFVLILGHFVIKSLN